MPRPRTSFELNRLAGMPKKGKTHERQKKNLPRLRHTKPKRRAERLTLEVSRMKIYL
jgi:lipase chaperone LimK